MCLPALTLGQLVATIILGFMGVEISTLLLISGKKMMKPFEEEEKIKSEGREYATRATTLGGLTFAAVALLVGRFYPNLQQLSNVFFLLGLSIGLFLVSYSVEALVRIRRLFWTVQDKTLWYGFVSVVVSLALFFQQLLPDVFPIMLMALLAIATIHSYEFYLDVKSERPIRATR